MGKGLEAVDPWLFVLPQLPGVEENLKENVPLQWGFC